MLMVSAKKDDRCLLMIYPAQLMCCSIYNSRKLFFND